MSLNAPSTLAGRGNLDDDGATLEPVGSSAVAPPSSTANMSSEIAPSTAGWRRMKRIPSSTDDSPGGDARARARSARIRKIIKPVSTKSAVLVPYTAAGPAT